jgi:hypothetical protein
MFASIITFTKKYATDLPEGEERETAGFGLDCIVDSSRAKR